MVVIARSICLMYGVIGLNLSSSRIDKGGSIHHHHPPFFKMMHLDDGVVMSEGWISIHRKILEWEWYSDINVCRVFIHCLIKANHTEKKWQGVAIKRGQFITSNATLAHECNLSVKQVRTSLDKLKETGEVASNSTNKYTVISMLNYEKYQNEGKRSGRQRANEGQAEGKRRATTNNVNNVNNVNKEEELHAEQKSSTPPLFKKLDAKDLEDGWLEKPLKPDNVIEMWNEIVVGESDTKKQIRVTTVRTDNIKRRSKDSLFTGQDWLGYFQLIKNDSFCMGEKGWKATIDWALKPTSITKMLEGGYNA